MNGGGGGGSFIAMLAICGFLSAIWAASKVSRVAGLPCIALEMFAGVILGPKVVGLINSDYTVCETRHHVECVPPPNFAQLVKEGLPLGKELGRIASMDYCDRDHYYRPDGTVIEYDDEPPTPHLPRAAHKWTAIDDEDDLGRPFPFRGQTDGVPDPNRKKTSAEEEHGNPDEGAAPAAEDGHRRLNAGGAVEGRRYPTYEECLMKSCEADIAYECDLAPDVFTLVGHAGVALMVFESGLHFDFEKANAGGARAWSVAVVGTLLPFLCGVLLMLSYGVPLVPDALAVGTALAPTSASLALRMLGEAGVLHHDFGQLIVTAASLNDMLSLVMFDSFFSLRSGFSVMDTVCNPIIGVAFMGVAVILALRVWPQAIGGVILPLLPIRPGHAKISLEDEVLFALMMGLLFLYAISTHYLGTHLMGCFLAGVSFTCLESEGEKGHILRVWARQSKRITTWMMRIFFACTVAFSINVEVLLTFESFWKGSLLGLGPSILAKVVCAPFVGTSRFVVGCAMVGRAEFAYYIAQAAAVAGLVDELTFSVCIWALMYATLATPLLFHIVLSRHIAEEGLEVLLPAPKGSAAEQVEEEDEDQPYDDHEKADPEVAESHHPPIRSRATTEATEASAARSPGGRRAFRWGREPAQGVLRSEKGLLCCLFLRP